MLSSKGAGAVSLGHVLNENLAYSSSERCSPECLEVSLIYTEVHVTALTLIPWLIEHSE